MLTDVKYNYKTELVTGDPSGNLNDLVICILEVECVS